MCKTRVAAPDGSLGIDAWVPRVAWVAKHPKWAVWGKGLGDQASQACCGEMADELQSSQQGRQCIKGARGERVWSHSSPFLSWAIPLPTRLEEETESEEDAKNLSPKLWQRSSVRPRPRRVALTPASPLQSHQGSGHPAPNPVRRKTTQKAKKTLRTWRRSWGDARLCGQGLAASHRRRLLRSNHIKALRGKRRGCAQACVQQRPRSASLAASHKRARRPCRPRAGPVQGRRAGFGILRAGHPSACF